MKKAKEKAKEKAKKVATEKLLRKAGISVEVSPLFKIHMDLIELQKLFKIEEPQLREIEKNYKININWQERNSIVAEAQELDKELEEATDKEPKVGTKEHIEEYMEKNKRKYDKLQYRVAELHLIFDKWQGKIVELLKLSGEVALSDIKNIYSSYFRA